MALKDWKKRGRSYWNEEESPHSKKVVIYRKKSNSYPIEVIIELLNQEGIRMLKRHGYESDKKYITLLYDNTIPENLGNFKTKSQALKFVKDYMRKH